MAAKKDTSAMDFIVEHLRKNKKASYAEVREAAEAKKFTIYPIMYGRAQTIVGIVKAKPRGQGKVAKAKAAAAAPAAAPAAASAPAMPKKRGPGRPPKSSYAVSAGIDMSSFDGIISAVRSSEQAKTRYRAALEKIQAILGDALS